MADEQNDSKGSDATKLILALIGLAGTVATGWFGYATVTHKNDDDGSNREAAQNDDRRAETESTNTVEIKCRSNRKPND